MIILCTFATHYSRDIIYLNILNTIIIEFMFAIEPILPSVKNQSLMIAGPCSAESREQVLETASALMALEKISLFRCGIWKPRSTPKCFEGHGVKALGWLKEVQEKYAVPTCIEIASAKHLESALQYNIRHFWIGARTSVNPFIVQEIAEATRGTEVSMMIKNPISPDLKLWIGAFERMSKVGIRKLAAIHRGFLTYEHSLYRNNPLWNIPIELKRLYQEIPIICDPSHMAGKKEYIFEIAQKALFLEADGLMLEVHAHPEKSLSDKEQQLTPLEYHQLINKLSVPISGQNLDTSIKHYRELIDELDKDLCSLLAKRFEIVREIALYKKEKNISLLQIERWQQVMDNVLQICEQKNINKLFIQQLMESLHAESIKIQEEIFKK